MNVPRPVRRQQLVQTQSSHKQTLPLKDSEYLPLRQGFSSPPSGLAHFAKASCCSRSRLSVRRVLGHHLYQPSLCSSKRRFKLVTTASGAKRTFIRKRDLVSTTNAYRTIQFPTGKEGRKTLSVCSGAGRALAKGPSRNIGWNENSPFRLN